MVPFSCLFGRHIWIDSLTPDIHVDCKGCHSVTVETKCLCCDEVKITTHMKET